MIHETTKVNDLQVQDVDFNIDSYLTEYIRDEKLAENIRTADVVLLPHKNFRELEGPFFSEAAVGLYQFLMKKLEENKVEICVEEDDYKEIALHDETLNLGIILLNGFILPIVVNVISEHIKSQTWRKKS
jgi:hypothetical protein